MDLAVWTVAADSLRLAPRLEAELPRVFAEVWLLNVSKDDM